MDPNLDAKAAMNLSPEEACNELDDLTCFLEELGDDHGLNYFTMEGHVNPCDHLHQMMLGLLISMLDRLESEGLFKPEGWRKIFKYWSEDGEFPEEFIRNSEKCPFSILIPSHYREDGSCKCSNAEHRKVMIRESGYTAQHFRNIPLVD